MTTGTDLEQRPATRTPVAFNAPLTLDEAHRLASALALSKMVPLSLQGKTNDVLAVILYGQEIGMRPMQAVQGIAPVGGRPVIAAQTWLALLRRAGHRARVVEHTAQSCTVELTRGDDGTVHVETFTIDEAVAADLVKIRDGKLYSRSASGKPLPWELHPKRMLLARAVSNAARFLCPEVALGFYSEADDFDDIEPLPVDARIVRPAGAEPMGEIVDAELVADAIDGIAVEFGEGLVG